MAITVDFGDGRQATIEGWRWTSADKSLQRMLNSTLDPRGPSGGDPYPDMTAAQDAIEDYGGEIIKADPPPKSRKGMIY